MGLFTLVKGLVLLANALAILNEDRFLAPRGWGFNETGSTAAAFKTRMIGLVRATQLFRLPLILVNTIVVVLMIVSG